MSRGTLLVLLTTLSLSGCAHWLPVPMTVNPAASTDPVIDLKAALNSEQFPPALLEVTDQYAKMTWVNGATLVLTFADVTDLRILHGGEQYRVVASDARGKELYRIDPRTHDFGTCQKFVNAFYAITKRPVPAATPGGAGDGAGVTTPAPSSPANVN